MDETKHLLKIMMNDLEGIQKNLVAGKYDHGKEYFGVLGEAKTLNKLIAEANKLIAKRQDYDD